MSTRAQITVAIIGLVGTLMLGYWQIGLRQDDTATTFEIVYKGQVFGTGSQLPVPNAKITLNLDGSTHIRYTDSEGLFQFPVTISPTSSGQIRVEADGYQLYTRNITLSGSPGYIEDIRLVHLLSVLPTETSLLLGTDISTETPIPTFLPTNTLTASPEPVTNVGNTLVQLIDNYYVCLNSASPGDLDNNDYERCWDLLSDRPGEIQSNLNKDAFFTYWQTYKVTYALFYCWKDFQGGVQHFVHTRYFLYNRNDDSLPLGNGSPLYLEYSFAHDNQGWRIKGANSNITDIGSFCESEPRINKLTNP
jgi:hypothetical protein